MAANGPKAMHRAGRYADGLVTVPKTWKEHKSEFEAGAKAVGKDASKMPVLVEQYVVVGDKGDAEKAAELWRFGPKASSLTTTFATRRKFSGARIAKCRWRRSTAIGPSAQIKSTQKL